MHTKRVCRKLRYIDHTLIILDPSPNHVHMHPRSLCYTGRGLRRRKNAWIRKVPSEKHVHMQPKSSSDPQDGLRRFPKVAEATKKCIDNVCVERNDAYVTHARSPNHVYMHPRSLGYTGRGLRRRKNAWIGKGCSPKHVKMQSKSTS